MYEAALDVDAGNDARDDIFYSTLAEVARLERAVHEPECGLRQDVAPAEGEPRDAGLALLQWAVERVRVVGEAGDVLVRIMPAALW